MAGVVNGDGFAIASLDSLGSGPGFRKVRRELGVEAFGINAVVMPPHYEGPFHYHEQQEETYFVHRGTLEFEFGDGSVHRVEAGGFVRVDAHTPRRVRNVGEDEAIFVCAGGKGGYVGRDGRRPDPPEGSEASSTK